MNKPVNFYQVTRCKNASAFTALLKYQSGNDALKIREREFLSMRILADMLYANGVSVPEMDGFVLSASFRFGKEFDLLKITPSACLNIELKSSLQSYPPAQADEKIFHQLSKNFHYLSVLGRALQLYTVVTDTMKCYHFTECSALEEVPFSEIVLAVKQFFGEYLRNIEQLFLPSEYLVSPLNHPAKFLAHAYFLTHDQEEKKKDILERFSGSAFLALTGEAGTGKTLMLYDIAKTLAEFAPVAVLHCAPVLPVSLSAIQHAVPNLSVFCPENFPLPEIQHYAYIFIDETQRIDFDLLSRIGERLKTTEISAFMTFEEKQILHQDEQQQKITSWITSHCDKLYTLKNTIRTNREIMHFIRKFYDLRYRIPPRIQQELPEHIQLCFAENGLELDNLKEYFQLPCNGGYQFIPLDACHAVIGQEFDHVMLILDGNFNYVNQKLHSENSALMHNLYQALTRARNKLIFLVTDENLFQHMLMILEDSEN